MGLRVRGSWSGWHGETVVHLSDGSYWQQVEYRYEYRYAYQPDVEICDGQMQVAGMAQPVRVRRISAVSSTIEGAWKGWNGTTELKLIDGSRWKQAEYHYEYHYAYRPEVIMYDGRMLVAEMTRPVRVVRLR